MTAQFSVDRVLRRWSRDPVSHLGVWSASLAAVSATVFSLAAILELLDAVPQPLGVRLIYASSLVLAVAVVVMLSCIHHTVSGPQRVWSFTGVVFGVLYASHVSVMYVVQLFVYLPKARRGTLSESERVLLADTFGTFLQAVDGLGYLFLGLATLAVAPVFTGGGVGRWVRRSFVANGVVTVPVFLTYFVDPGFLPLAGLWVVVVPVSTLLVAVYFRRRSHADTE
jgi:hypothetical protein